nr:MAG TPA: hypothetical protein [Crassvirales sp.]
MAFLFVQNPADCSRRRLSTLFFYRISTTKQIEV